MTGTKIMARPAVLAVVTLVAFTVSTGVATLSAGSYLMLKRRIDRALEAPSPDGTPDAGAAEAPGERTFEAVAKNDVFRKNRTPSKASIALVGFWGDAALLAQGNNVEETRLGESAFGFKLVAMSGNSVDVEYEGETRHLELFQTLGLSGGSPESRPEPEQAAPPAEPAAPAPEAPSAPRSEGERRGRRGRFRDMSAEEREGTVRRLREQH